MNDCFAITSVPGYAKAPMSDVTRMLSAIEQGDPSAVEQLLPLVYEELRKLAAQKLAKEKPGQTLQATALVHEAYLRLVPNPGCETVGNEPHWNSRKHFFAAAAEAMHRILVDQARHKNSSKGGGNMNRLPLDSLAPLAPEGEPIEDLLALDEALQELEAEDPIKAQLVKLRYFTGTSLEETAQMLDISEATAKRYWVYVKSWLYGKLHDQ